MDITVKIERFQIKQNVLNLKSTLMHTDSDNTCELLKLMLLNPGLFAHILNDSVIFSDYPADVPKLSLVPLSETKESPFENDLDSTHKSEGESSLELNESIEDIEMSDV